MKYLYFVSNVLFLVNKVKLVTDMPFLEVEDTFDYQKELTFKEDLPIMVDMSKIEILLSLTKKIGTLEELEIIYSEQKRIKDIKAMANQLIIEKYSIEWQLNHPRVLELYQSAYAYIDNIRLISNEAESDGIALDSIDWNKYD